MQQDIFYLQRRMCGHKTLLSRFPREKQHLCRLRDIPVLSIVTVLMLYFVQFRSVVLLVYLYYYDK